LPYSVSGDFLNGGTSIEYRPGYWFVERVGIGVPLSPIVWQSGQGGRMMSAAGFALLLHLDSVALPEVQLGARFTQTWQGISDGSMNVRPGAELAGYFLAGKLRLSVGVGRLRTDRRHAPRLVNQARPRRPERPHLLGPPLPRWLNFSLSRLAGEGRGVGQAAFGRTCARERVGVEGAWYKRRLCKATQ
jgi:hypothetical protein